MTSHQDTIANLWTAARAMFARMRAAIGEAASIAARAALSRDERRAVRQWLAPLEAMARKVVLIHALALARRGDTHARPPRPANSARAHARSPLAAPAMTLIQLAPPPVRILTHAAAAAAAPRQRMRPPALRLWARAPVSPRVRDVGASLLVRDIARDRTRLARARHLNAVRRNRAPEPQRLARRIDALARLIERPLVAARRLARKLALNPMLAIKLAARRTPRSRLYSEPEYAACRDRACADAYAFTLKPCDSS